MIDLADLAVLVEAVQQGSLSAAGRRLGLTPVAASRRLAALEAELGVRLVHRTTRSLSLTPEGEAFLPHAEAMLDHAEEGRAAAAPGAADVSGVLRIAASVPFGRKVVTPMLAGFLRAHPRLRAELRLSDALVDVAAQGVDVALRFGELRDNGLVARRLADNPRSLYASPGYLAEHGSPTTLDDLRRHACLTVPGSTHWAFERHGRAVRQAVGGRFVADSVDALHQASLDGLGIVLLSEWNVRDDVDAGRLAPIGLVDAAVPDQGIWAVLPTRRFLPRRTRLFLDAFAAHLAAAPAPEP
ncbi:LysR family transcriptional regulator [Sphingomonas sp. S2-65]|uniref:LysR family transcriptional regulator n=1 Tax=Sphingomonas sp. S2-65 TaxID=2903960 RepID=UPI001F29FA9B|nr:LysR family transcriptional regulator [Sphingomonas sp. S2-65]UYY58431.1 LysR family transcriptional regulator [Sphingomonas sp. S2-65]